MQHPIGHSLGALCFAWNAATSPYTPRTDKEHTRMRLVARAIDARLKRNGQYGQWRELSNGARMPRWSLS